MNIWKVLEKEERERRHGNIMRLSSLWVWKGTYPDLTEYYPTEQGGRTMVLVEKEAVICYDAERWPDNPTSEGGGKYVDWKACRKCEHHIMAKHSGNRRVSCRWLIDWRKRRASEEAAELAKAINEAFEVLRK